MISKLNFRLAPPSADETLHCLSSLLRSRNSGVALGGSCRQGPGPSTASGDVVPHDEVLSTGSYYLKKARARTCWFRHPPYTLAVAALATAYNSMGLGELRRRLLQECDARARLVTGRGIDIHGVATCADAMASDERASAAVAAASLKAQAQARGNAESPVCGGGGRNEDAVKEGWGSPTGVAQGAAELLQKAAFAAVGMRNAECGGGGGGGGVPLVEDFSPPRTFSPSGEVPTKAAAAHVVAGRRVIRRVSSSPRASAPRPRVSTSPRDISAPFAAAAAAAAAPARRVVPVSTSPLDVERIAVAAVAPRRVSVASQPYREPHLQEAAVRRRISGGEGGRKRRLHQSIGSCFEPCARRRSVEGTGATSAPTTVRVGRRVDVEVRAEPSHRYQDQDLNIAGEQGQEQGFAYPSASSESQQQQQQQQQQPLPSIAV